MTQTIQSPYKGQVVWVMSWGTEDQGLTATCLLAQESKYTAI